MSQVLLLIDRAERRRRLVSIGLSEFSYEVVPALDVPEGLRYALALAPQVIVAVDQAIAGERAALEALFDHVRDSRVQLVLLDTGAAELGEVPDHVLLVSVARLLEPEVVERLRILLLGRQLELETDLDLRSLVGDFAQVPFSSLLSRLCAAGVSGRLSSNEGWIELRRGEIWGAQVGALRGIKAFGRLAASWSDGLFHLRVGSVSGEREIEGDTPGLLDRAAEDALGEVPNRRARADLGEVAPTVTVVTDSSADLPRELLRSHGILVVPLTIRFGEKSFRDRIDLTPGAFYELLAAEREHPSTEPPSSRDFAETYAGLGGRAEVVSIHISGKMSQTVTHAREAVTALRRGGTAAGVVQGRLPDLVVVDGAQVSLPLGLLCLFAARMAARGLSGPEIANRIGGMRARVHSLFVVDTLEYLARGGRIGRARALLGQLLRIKPILGVVEGEVAALDRARGGRAAQLKMVELFKARVDVQLPVVLCIAHAAAPAWAERLQALLAADFKVAEIIATEMGPVVGTHAGPGTVGAALFQAESAEEAELTSPLSL